MLIRATLRSGAPRAQHGGRGTRRLHAPHLLVASLLAAAARDAEAAPFEPIVGIHVAFPAPGRRTRGGFSLGFMSDPVYYTPVSPAVGGTLRFDFADQAPSRVSALFHMGLAVRADGNIVTVATPMFDIGAQWQHRVPRTALAIGGRVRGGYVFSFGEVGWLGRLANTPKQPLALEDGAVWIGANPLAPALLATEFGLFSEGRPLRRDGRIIDVPVSGTDGLSPLAKDLVDAARNELAAVSTFVRTACELDALGAPAALVGACLRAAAEEARHVWDQLLLAARVDPNVVQVRLSPVDPSPRTMPRSRFLATLAAESWVDGVHGEADAARDLRRRRDIAADPHVATTLDRIATEETSHATLSARVVDWCLGEDRLAVRRVLASAS